MERSTIQEGEGKQSSSQGRTTQEDEADQKRTRMLKMIEMLVEKRQANINASAEVQPPTTSGHTDKSITGPLPAQAIPSRTIKCKLPDLINNEPCKLFTEETRHETIVYRFGPVLIDDDISDSVAPSPTAPSQAGTPLISKTKPMDAMNTRSTDNRNMSHIETTTTPASSSTPASPSSDLLIALAPSFDPHLLDLLDKQHQPERIDNTKEKHAKHKRCSKNHENSHMDLITFEPPPLLASSLSLSTTSSSSVSTSSTQSPSPLSLLSIVTPSPTTKEPLVHHPTFSRYSRTSFYRPPSRTIVTPRSFTPPSQ